MNGRLQRSAVEVQHAQAFARRTQQDAQHRGHGSLGDAAGPGKFRVLIDTAAQDRFAAAEGTLGQVLTETGAGGDLLLTRGQGPQLERALWSLGENDGAALGVQRAHGIIQNGMQQNFFAFDVHEGVSGTQQGQQLLAGPGAAVAVEGDALHRVFPGVGARLDQDLRRQLLFLADLFQARKIDDQGDVAAADDVVGA